MKLIEPKVKLIQQQPSLIGMYKHIERCARTCYKTEDSITENSYEKLCDKLMKAGHLAMFEHGTVYLKDISWNNSPLEKYENNKYSRYNNKYLEKEEIEDGNSYDVDYKYAHYVTTNLRVIIENHWEDDLEYICEPTEFHEKRYTVRFTCDRGVSHELVRHRVFSFAQESTRYCNYSKNKFGNELTFIIPSWCTNIKPNVLEYSPFEITPKEAEFMQACFDSEKRYFSMLKSDATPQEARQVLINALKTEIVMTGFIKDWKHFFSLRTSFIAATGKPHPDMSNLADNLYTRFKKEQFI